MPKVISKQELIKLDKVGLVTDNKNNRVFTPLPKPVSIDKPVETKNYDTEIKDLYSTILAVHKQSQERDSSILSNLDKAESWDLSVSRDSNYLINEIVAVSNKRTLTMEIHRDGNYRVDKIRIL